MNIPVWLILFALTKVAFASEKDGVEALLAFDNGDQLHGHYLGFAEKRLIWKRGDLAKQAEFDPANLRRVIFRNGRPESPLKRISHVATIHGDRIPAEVVSLDGESLVLESGYAGRLEIPRSHIGMLAPMPYGGRMIYQGPFAADDWRVLELQGLVAGESEVAAEEEPGGWTHAGAAWYWPANSPVKGLALERDIPASMLIRCHISWKSRISLALAFHADFKAPPQDEADEEELPGARRRIHLADSNIYAGLFGNSYVLQVNPTHALLYRSVVDDEGGMRVERMQTTFNNVNLGESGAADLEIRASRITGEISLFINDEFVAQWSEIGHIDGAGGPAHEYAGLGGGMGFLVQSPNAAIRISDIVVCEWNGMPDAARSMQMDDQDVVLLTNGTDRFSGKIENIRDGRVSIAGRYGDFDFPFDDVAEIRFARNGLATPVPAPSGSIRLRSHPVGLMTGIPLSGDGSQIRLDHPSFGIINVDLAPVVMMEMQLGESFLDAWDPDL